MKKHILFLLGVFISGAFSMYAQNADSLGLPGDHFDLTGVLEIFKTAKSPEDFEKTLNLKDSKVNNLDLNGDGKVDYIRVVDHATGNSHIVVLQDAINEKETQDVAVIEIEKKSDGIAELQIIGDKELYGDKYIVAPISDESKTTGEDGKFIPLVQQVVFVNVYYWPCVQYIWYPGYVVYVSPWYWSYWPGWWYPWGPYPYAVYYGYWYPHHHYYYWCDDYYYHEANNYYGPRRTASTVVEHRYADQHKTYEGRKNTIPSRNVHSERPAPAKPVDRPAEQPKQNPPSPKQGTSTPPPPTPNQNPPVPKQGTSTPPPPSQNQNPPVPKQGTSTPPPHNVTPPPAPTPRPKSSSPQQRKPKNKEARSKNKKTNK